MIFPAGPKKKKKQKALQHNKRSDISRHYCDAIVADTTCVPPNVHVINTVTSIILSVAECQPADIWRNETETL